jgi:tripartite-type tricarboxylate transporter receptor subunit TctC
MSANLPAAAQDSKPGAWPTVRMTIGFGPGGGYDLWARTIAKHLGKHLPGNPTVISENMPGAGSYRAANYVYNVAPKDGSVIGAIARDAALGPITGMPGAQFDATKFSWLGTPTTETNVCISYKTSPVKTVQDLYTKTFTVGDTGPGTGTQTYPKVLSAMFGMKFKIIGGYPSSSDVFLAMERGEVEGICESLDSVTTKRASWIKDKEINILFQGGAVKDPHLPDVPFIGDIVKTPEEKTAIEFLYAGQGVGRPYIAPPGMPADKLKTLRAAFDATMKDPEFIEDAKKVKLDVEPEDGEHLAALINKIYSTPKPLVDKIGEIIKAK